MKNLLNLTMLLGLLAINTNSHAIIVTGNATIDESNTITIDYLFEASSMDVFSFDLFFDFNTFDNLEVTSNTTMGAWDTEVFQSASFFGFEEDGLVSFFSNGDALLVGTSLMGFQITADFIGATVPAFLTQAFDIIDPNTFSPIGFGGETSPIAVTPAQVNAPASFFLLSLGLTGLMLQRKRQARD
jgi:hypothetical protein